MASDWPGFFGNEWFLPKFLTPRKSGVPSAAPSAIAYYLILKERTKPGSINWASGSMVLVVALFLVVASSSPIGNSFFRCAKSFAQV